MNQDNFVKEKEEHWKDLALLLDNTKKGGIKEFSASEIRTLGSLYRKACSDLSYARSRGYNKELVRYLNQLVRRAYGIIYLTDKNRKSNLFRFFDREYPKLLRDNFNYIFGAILIFILFSVIAFIWDQADPSFSEAMIPRQFLELWKEAEMEDTMGAAAFPQMSAWYLTHNFTVGIYSFLTGITLGLGTVFLMAQNGIILGGIASMVIRHGHSDRFFSFVISHAPIELMAIFICGGAGLMIARALIAPGDLYVRDSLNKYGIPAVRLVIGTIPMFLLAGIIEASISRMALPFFIKALFSIATILAMIIYYRRDPEASEPKRKYKIEE